MPPAQGLVCARSQQLAGSELRDRFEKPIARLGTVAQIELHERFIDERFDLGIDFRVDDVLDRLDRAAARKDRKRREGALLRLCQQVVTPRDCGSQRAMALVNRRVFAGEQHRSQPLGHAFQRHRPDPRGGQFDRQRNAVEAVAHLGDGSSALEKEQRTVERFEIDEAPRVVGRRERRKALYAFAGEMKGFSTGNQTANVWTF